MKNEQKSCYLKLSHDTSPRLQCEDTYFLVVVLRPLYLLEEVAEVTFEGHVMLVGREVLVEVFVVVGVLFQHECVATQQVGEAIGRHRAVYVDLILVLQEMKHG